MDQLETFIFPWIIIPRKHVDLLMFNMKIFVMLKMPYIMNNMSVFMAESLMCNMLKGIVKLQDR